MPAERGVTLAHYRLVEKIGQGGMADVWRAVDEKLHRDVALKILPRNVADDPERLERFDREAKVVAALNHPTIVTLYGVEEIDATPVLAMELIDGETLGARLARGPLEPRTLVELGVALADALATAHRKGVVHRDLKAANIMFNSAGRPKILDFGLAKLLRGESGFPLRAEDESDSLEGLVLGTLPYMSPEQIRGEDVDPRSDIFSLGVVLYEAATGRRPFQGETPSELVTTLLEDDPVPCHVLEPALPRQLGRILARCLAKKPDRRYASMLELRDELADLDRELELQGVLGDRSASTRSIAVLPFTDMSPGKDQQYLCDGLAEDVINSLSQVEGLQVAARTSSFSFKGKEVDVRELGAKLDVETVLEGSVQKSGSRLRITAQLVNVADGYRLWSERYDREMDDVFKVQDEISLALAEKLKVGLLGPSEPLRRHTENVEAYDLYLQGRFDWYRRTGPALRRARGYFQQAIEKDPGYALAHVGLADCYNTLGFYSYVPPREAFPHARDAAVKALRLDESLAEAHVSLGYMHHYYDWDVAEAERHYRRGLELKPTYPLAYQWYFTFLVTTGRHEEALEQCRRALALDPLSVFSHTAEGWGHIFRRDYDRALLKLLAAQEIDPTYPLARLWCGWAHLQKGSYDEGIAELKTARSLDSPPAMTDAYLAYAHGLRGDQASARLLLEKLRGHEYVPPYFVALVHIGLGETAEAFAELERAYEERSHWLVFLRVDPRLDPLRADTLFAGLERRVASRR